MNVWSPSILNGLTRYLASNSTVTAITAGQLDIVTLDLGTLIAGQILLLNWSTLGTKGATPGDVFISANRLSGTGQVQWPSTTQAATLYWPAFPALSDMRIGQSANGLVSTSGTYVLRLVGFSLGSDLTIAAPSTRLQVLQFTR